MTSEDITFIEELLGQTLQPWQRRLLEYEPTKRWLAIQQRELDPSAGILLIIIDRLLQERPPLSSAKEKARAEAYAMASERAIAAGGTAALPPAEDEVESWSLGAEELRARNAARDVKAPEPQKESGWLG